MYILSVDFGTSSVKIAILDYNCNVVEMVSIDYKYRILNEDWVELDPDEVFSAMLTGIKRMSKYLDEVEAVAYDTFSPSMVFMDKGGVALYPIITHLDRRSKKQTQMILDQIGKEDFQSITGVLPFTGGVSITTILWVMENMPKVFANTYKFGHLNTYIYHKLTDVWAIDPTNASMMGLYETTKWGSWSDDILKTFGIPMDKLPPILLAGTIAGSLTKKASKLTGLREGIPIALGSNDATTAQIAMGNKEVGDILNISGSSEIISIITDKPITNEKYYLRNAITPGKWQVFAITVGGFAVDWFRGEFYKDMDKDRFFNIELPFVIENYIHKASVEFSPHIAGNRQSLVTQRGAFYGLTLDTTRRDMLAALLLAIHEPIVDTLNICKEFIPLSKTIKLTGGMLHEPYLNLKKAILNEYKIFIKSDCPIIGNAILMLESMKNQ